MGKHGIIIELKLDSDHRSYKATYLPEVMKEQNWTKEEAIFSLLKKAGFKNSINQNVLNKIELVRYQSSKYALSYNDYNNGH